jgi:hypothetical protein
MKENGGDGKCRLWNPPFDLLPVVLKKMDMEGARGAIIGPMWTAQPWYARLLTLSTAVRVLYPSEDGPLYTGQRKGNPAWKLLVVEVGLSTSGSKPFAQPF